MAEPRSGDTPRGCAAPKGAPIHKPTLPSVETLGYDLPSRVRDSITAVYPRYQRRELIIKSQTKKLSHYDSAGRASMVDVSGKQPSVREAEASAFVAMSAEVLRALPQNPKGDPLEVARIAGIQAAKRTSELIPMCHPIPLSKIDVQAKVERDGIAIKVLAASHLRVDQVRVTKSQEQAQPSSTSSNP